METVTIMDLGRARFGQQGGGKAVPASRGTGERPGPSGLLQVLLILPGVTLMVSRARSRSGAKSRSAWRKMGFRLLACADT